MGKGSIGEARNGFRQSREEDNEPGDESEVVGQTEGLLGGEEGRQEVILGDL